VKGRTGSSGQFLIAGGPNFLTHGGAGLRTSMDLADGGGPLRHPALPFIIIFTVIQDPRSGHLTAVSADEHPFAESLEASRMEGGDGAHPVAGWWGAVSRPTLASLLVFFSSGPGTSSPPLVSWSRNPNQDRSSRARPVQGQTS